MASFNKTTAAGGAGAVVAFILLCCSFIAPHEGITYKAYSDVGSVWTICRGHTKNVHAGDIATPAQCAQLFHDDTVEAIATVDFLTSGALIPPETKKVFVDEVFNAGAGNFAKSTMLKKIKAGDLAGACRQFPRWHYAGGKDCTIRANNCYGIVTRRAQQMAECLKGLKS